MGRFVVLVVDDEKNIRRTLSLILEGEGYEVLTAERAEDALKIAADEKIDLMLLDIRLGGMSGMDALPEFKSRDPELPIIMISGHATLSDAVEATKRGAYDFLEKPLDRERVLVAVRNGLEKSSIGKEVKELRAKVDKGFEILGDSLPMRRLKDQITRVAPTRARVLITGESGVGKELVAREVHRLSSVSKGAFIKVNCAAIPAELIESELFGHEKGSFSGAMQRRRGQFELADQGTLFLDEIGDMSLTAQAKVLRVLQTGELTRVGGERPINVDVRVLAATNKELEVEVKRGQFREDLFFRLNVVPILVPPLRDRKEDIPTLCARFVDEFCRENGLRTKPVDPEVLSALSTMRWPGNIRELKNVFERLVIMSGDKITLDDIADGLSASPAFEAAIPPAPRLPGSPKTLREFKEEMEREFIKQSLTSHDWNVSKTAEALGIERTNLHKKIKSFGLDREDSSA
jgi:two-component system, NtrC family, nitrogen regulation response regulator NtrX